MVVRYIISTCHFLYESIRYAVFIGLRLLTKLMSLIFFSCKLKLHFFFFFFFFPVTGDKKIDSIPSYIFSIQSYIHSNDTVAKSVKNVSMLAS